MMEKWYDFLIKIKPDGKVFRSICFSKILYEVVATAIQIVKNYAVYHINDQVWYTNDNFDPEIWEDRYGIIPPVGATLEERSIQVRAYMSYPQSKNRLSRDYIYNTLIEAGYTGVEVDYNPTGESDGFLHANGFSDEKSDFLVGPLTYNSFIITGVLSAAFYVSAINLAMSLKPLQVVIYDTIEVYTAIAIDDNFALAIDDALATTLTTL